MSWKQVLLLVLAIDLLVLGVLAFVFTGMAVATEPGEIAGLTSDFPVGTREVFPSSGWQGTRYVQRFRVMHRPDDPATKLPEMIGVAVPQPWLQRSITLGKEGWYVIRKRSKGYTLYAVFRTGETIYWCDYVSVSTLDHGLQFFHRFLLNLRLAGEPADQRLAGELAEIERAIPVWFIQGPLELLGFLAAVFSLAFGSIFLVMRASGNCPNGLQERSLLCNPHVTVKIKALGTQISPCCLALEGDHIVAYRYRKPFLTIPLKEEKGKLTFADNRILYQNYTFRLPPEVFQQWRMMIG